MKFRITIHSGFGAPADALDLLYARMGARREEARFAKNGSEISATWGEDASVSMGREEREEIGRLALLEILSNLCEQAPELRSDWFAVSPRRY